MCFFLQSFQKVNENFQYLFQNDIGDSGDGSILSANFEKHFGWIYNIKCVAEFEGIKMDDVYLLPVQHFLNDLSYLKMKRALDAEQEKKIAQKNKTK